MLFSALNSYHDFIRHNYLRLGHLQVFDQEKLRIEKYTEKVRACVATVTFFSWQWWKGVFESVFSWILWCFWDRLWQTLTVLASVSVLFKYWRKIFRKCRRPTRPVCCLAQSDLPTFSCPRPTCCCLRSGSPGPSSSSDKDSYVPGTLITFEAEEAQSSVSPSAMNEVLSLDDHPTTHESVV